MTRLNARKNNEVRPIDVQLSATKYAEGSVLFCLGDTKVLCNATVEESRPSWLKDNNGWITAEYSMLPRATGRRTERRRVLSGGRTLEISRLIGRSLRTCVCLSQLGPRQIIVDCDVLQADGGTRTAAITGGYIALRQCIEGLLKAGKLSSSPVRFPVAAISCGLLNERCLLDLDYGEDTSVTADANFVLNSRNEIIEIQMSAEKDSVREVFFQEMLSLARSVMPQLMDIQRSSLKQIDIHDK